MNHTIRQQKMFDHITQKHFGSSEPSIPEEMLKGLGALVAGIFLGVVIVFCAGVLWMTSKGYLDYFVMKFAGLF